MTGPLPTGIFGFDSDLEVPRTDLAKAKEFLAKTLRRPAAGSS